MHAIINNKLTKITKNDLNKLLNNYKKVHIDIGTGDGRFVYKNARENPDTFYIGVDPSQKQLEVNLRKIHREKIKNCLFVVGSIEIFPVALFGTATSVSVLFPWGSLLKVVVDADHTVVEKLKSLFKAGDGKLDIIFGYSQNAEPAEVNRLGLNKLNASYIYASIVPAFMQAGFKVVCVKELKKGDLKGFETTWSKKLSFGQDRPVFWLGFESIGEPVNK